MVVVSCNVTWNVTWALREYLMTSVLGRKDLETPRNVKKNPALSTCGKSAAGLRCVDNKPCLVDIK